MASEKILAYILGSESLDTYDKFVQDMNDMGLETLVSLKQAAYDRYLAR